MKDKELLINKHIRPMAPIATGITPELRKLKRFKAMLFDVYGTLLISRAGEIGFDQKLSKRRDGVKELLQRYGIESSPEQIFAKLQRAVERSHEDSRRKGIVYPEVDVVHLWKLVLGSTDTSMIEDFALEYELIVNTTYPMPGLEALIAFCNDKEIPAGIISNAQFYTPCLLSYFLGESRVSRAFDKRLLFYSWQGGHAKPSTFMFRQAKKAIEEMGISIHSTLYVGNDMRNDILPAALVGFSTALYAGDQRSLRLREEDDRCRVFRPDLIITDLHQLIDGISTL